MDHEIKEPIRFEYAPVYYKKGGVAGKLGGGVIICIIRHLRCLGFLFVELMLRHLGTHMFVPSSVLKFLCVIIRVKVVLNSYCYCEAKRINHGGGGQS